MQDIATASPTKQQPALARERSRSKREFVRVLVLGLQVWVIGCAWPLMDAARNPRAFEYGLALAALFMLCGGALVRAPSAAMPQRQWLRAGLWLLGFPAALAGACAVRPEHWNQVHYASLGLCTLWLTLCVYAATAAAVSSEPAERLQCTIHARGGEDAHIPREGAAMQRIWVALCVAGAIAITLIAPTLGGAAQLEREWGQSAATGGVLTAVVAGALGVTTLAVFLGQGLRDQRPMPRPPRRLVLKRALVFGLLALLGAGTFIAVS